MNVREVLGRGHNGKCEMLKCETIKFVWNFVNTKSNMVEDHKGIKQIGIAYDSGCRVIDWMRERERERE